MAIEFQMPKLGLTMESGQIVEWLVADGAKVSQGDSILIVQTDKVDTEIEASASGRLHIAAVAGEAVDCGGCIGWFLDDGETAPAASVATPAARVALPAANQTVQWPSDRPSAAANGGRLFASPNARRVAASLKIAIEHVRGTGPAGRIVSEDVLAVRERSDAMPDATHAAHQVANRFGIDLRDVAAHGPEPRINRDDVERHVRERLANEATSSSRSRIAPDLEPVETPLLQTPTSTVPLTGMRGTIASRMHGSLRSMAQLTLTMDVNMDAVVAHRAASDAGTRASFTDYVVAAVAAALHDHPVVNSQIAGGVLALLPDINVGLAVALPGGLVVPVIKRTNTLSLVELSKETSRLAAAARSGSLSRDDIEGGTFSVTALGAYGVDAFTPVINPPNTAILGIGRVRDGVQWDGDTPVKTKLATLSLTWDHRAFDGVPAAEFTATVRDRLVATPN